MEKQRQNNQRQGNNQGQGKDKFFIKIDEPLKFVSTIGGELTTSIDLCGSINTLFKSIFQDYEGSVMMVNNFGQPSLTLFFKEKGGGDIVPLTSRAGGNSPSERLNRMNLRNKSKTYDVSDKLKDVIEQFSITTGRQKINWDSRVNEIAQQSYGMSSILVAVSDIDINKILKTLYGATDKETGAKYEYQVSIIKPMGMGGFNQEVNYVIKVDRLNLKKVDELAGRIGLMPSTGTIPMVRA